MSAEPARPAVPSRAPAADRDPSRAHWLELFFGRPARGVLRWAVPALALTGLLGVATTLLPAASVIYCTVLVLASIVASTELGERRRSRALPVA